MTQYISSYLLEPVARRLSRPASASESYDASSPIPHSRDFSSGSLDVPMHDADESTNDDSQDASQVDRPAHSRQVSASAGVAIDRDASRYPSDSHRLQHIGRARHHAATIPSTDAARIHHAHDISPHGRDYVNQLRREWRSSRPDSFEQTTSSPCASTQPRLPEDDGMGILRRKILAIQTSDRPTSEKSRLVHALMTERYSAQQALPRFPPLRSESAMSTSSVDRPVTPSSACSWVEVSSPATSCSVHAGPTIQVSEEDRQPTYYAPPAQSTGVKAATRKERSDHVLGCAHYQRNVKLQCSICAKWYTCRFCHDALEDHALKRHETRNMLCMLCGAAQPAAEQCRECEQSAAWYYCDICKLWDNDPEKSIYHCDDCGICRVGKGLGKDFFHCKICSACLSIAIRDSHRCIERSTDCDCPICGEYMFTSPQTVVFMPCGHSIHYSCYNEHVQTSFKCPLCSRSLGNMEMAFREIDRAIESQPMPPQFAETRAWISCNDCCGKSLVRYHWLGLKCTICDSYNTVQLQMSYELATEDEGASTRSHSPLNSDGSAQNIPFQAAVQRPHGQLNVARLATGPRSNSLFQGVSNRQHGVDRRSVRRIASLPSVVAPPLSLEERMPAPPRFSRSPAEAETLTHDTESEENSAATSTSSDPDGDDDDDDDDDDVDFWGGESPRSGALAVSRWLSGDVDMLNDDEGGESSDAEGSTDEDPESHDGDEDDGIGVVVGFGPGSIELIGHR